MISIQQQVECAKRELAKRRAIYPRLRDERKLASATAEKEIAAMEAIVETLTKLQHLSDISEELRGPDHKERQEPEAEPTQLSLI